MITITHTRLEIADCNSTLQYLEPATTADPLPLFAAATWNTLYGKVSTKSRTYSELFGKPGTILHSLRRVYSKNKFWRKYLQASDIDSSHETALDSLLPISATLTEKVELVNPPGVQVSPQLEVLIHPFGWSTWLSLKIVGDHYVETLADLKLHFMTNAAFRLQSNPGTLLTLTDLFDFLNKGVRQDVGAKAKVVNPQEFLTVMTVLAKHGGSLSLGGLTANQELSLKELLRPEGPPLTGPIDQFSKSLRSGNPMLDFVLHDGNSWFLWAEHMLKSESRYFDRLRCYHNNIFRSLQQAWLLHHLLRLANSTKPWSPMLRQLIERVLQLLGGSEKSGIGGYRNASLVDYLNKPEVQASIAAAQKRLDASA